MGDKIAAMPMLPARGYVSEHTQFIRGLLRDKPQIEREQREQRESMPLCGASGQNDSIDGKRWTAE